MELLIALLVSFGIVTSDDAFNRRYSDSDLKIMAADRGIGDEQMAKYEVDKKKEAEKITEEETDF